MIGLAIICNQVCFNHHQGVPRFMDPCILVFTMPNVDDEGFPGIPLSPWSINTFSFGHVLTRVFEKGSYGVLGVCSVCVKERKMDYNSPGVKMSQLGNFDAL